MGFKKKCIVIVSDGVGNGDFDDEHAPASFIKIAQYWSKNQNSKGGKKTCEMLSKHLKASFNPLGIPKLKSLLVSLDDVEAGHVQITGFDFSWNDDENSNIPSVTAAAVFEIEFKNNVTQEDISDWEQKADETIGFCLNFFWEFDDIKVKGWESYLDTNSGITFELLEE